MNFQVRETTRFGSGVSVIPQPPNPFVARDLRRISSSKRRYHSFWASARCLFPYDIVLNGHRAMFCSHRTMFCGRRKLFYGRLALISSHRTMVHGHRMLLYGHRPLLNGHRPLFYGHRTLFYGHRTLSYIHRTMLFGQRTMFSGQRACSGCRTCSKVIWHVLWPKRMSYGRRTSSMAIELIPWAIQHVWP